jgi:hypothetical protein
MYLHTGLPLGQRNFDCGSQLQIAQKKLAVVRDVESGRRYSVDWPCIACI